MGSVSQQRLSTECYQRQDMKKKALFDEKVKARRIKKHDLVLIYKNELNTYFDKKFLSRWEGPFVMQKVYPIRYFHLTWMGHLINTR